MITYAYIYRMIIIIVFIPFILKNIKQKKSVYYNIVFIGYVMYIISLIGILFFPIMYDERVFVVSQENVKFFNVVPFNTIIEISETNPSLIVKQLAGNMLIFVPMGFLMPLLNNKFRKFLNCIFLIVSISVSIEFTQLILDLLLIKSYRVSDIDDVILNTLGGIIGFMIFLISDKLFKVHEKINSK